MRGMEEIKRIPAGVMFESDMLALVDAIALEQRRSRSFIINTIIRMYARQQEQAGTPVKTAQVPSPQVIKF